MNWETILAEEGTRGIMAAGLIVLLSAPLAYLGRLFRAIPDDVLPPQEIPKLLAMLGLVVGWILGSFAGLPMDLAITVGVGAGWGAGTASSHLKGSKP